MLSVGVDDVFVEVGEEFQVAHLREFEFLRIESSGIGFDGLKT